MATMSVNLGAAVARACARADRLGIDLKALTETVRDRAPGELNNATAMRSRRQFLETQHSDLGDGEQAFERIIAGNELQPANYLARGALVARPVMRIVLRSAGGGLIGYGTGFLVGPGVLITNHHVLPDAETARFAVAEAHYELGIEGTAMVPLRYALDPDRLYYTSTALDFSIVAVAPRDRDSGQPLAGLGWLPLFGGTGKALEGEWLTIIQHPKGDPKQLCARDNQLLKKDTDVLWYSTDTLGGSSGSPVFNNDWLVVALHHSGVPETKDGRWQTIDDRDYDAKTDSEDQIKWLANEGIRVSRIVQTLQGDAAIAGHDLVRRMLDLTPADLQSGLPVITDAPLPADALTPAPAAILPTDKTAPRETSMTRFVTVTIAIDDDGQVRLADGTPMHEADLVAEA
ncbi:MAG TPA: serine protease, partial [Sphingomonas sp.]|nr:serine protease [Sphingomonas sp.]